MPRRRTTLAVLAAIAAALVASLSLPAIGSAQSRTNVIVGLGDQRASIFSDPNYQALGLKRARYFIRWDAIRNPAALAAADQYVAAAKAAGVKVLMHISTNNLAPRAAKLPTVSQYRRDVGAGRIPVHDLLLVRPLGPALRDVGDEARDGVAQPLRAAQVGLGDAHSDAEPRQHPGLGVLRSVPVLPLGASVAHRSGVGEVEGDVAGVEPPADAVVGHEPLADGRFGPQGHVTILAGYNDLRDP